MILKGGVDIVPVFRLKTRRPDPYDRASHAPLLWDLSANLVSRAGALQHPRSSPEEQHDDLSCLRLNRPTQQ